MFHGKFKREVKRKMKTPIFKSREQAAIGFGCIAVISLGCGFWFLFEAMSIETSKLVVCLLVIAVYFALAGLTTGIALMLLRLPRFRRFLEEEN
jgi:hypothetical protein